jgi:cell division protein FtsA
LNNSNLLVGLDIGTTRIKAVVADTSASSMQIIGSADEPTRGMRHGKIVDIDETADSISKALKSLSAKTNMKIYRVVTGIPIALLQLQPAVSQLNISDQGKGREITDQDVEQVIAKAINSSLQKGREAISFLPSKFLLDNQTEVHDPRKMLAHSLQVHGILLTAPENDLHNIRKALERAGYQNNFFIPAPLAISSVALDEAEANFGAIILDLGGGTSTATVIRNNKIVYAKIDAEGGDNVTHDISVALNTSLKDAENVKLDFGFAEPDLTSETEKFPVNVVGQSEPQMVDEHYLSEIINARLERIIGRLGKGLSDHNSFEVPGGIVITGGASNLQGIADLINKDLGVKVRIYRPDQFGLSNAMYAAAYGITNYAFNLADIDYLANRVIYGGATTSKRETESTNIFKRHALEDEIEAKEDYNNKQVAARPEPARRSKAKAKKEKNTVRNFFKKFFD